MRSKERRSPGRRIQKNDWYRANVKIFEVVACPLSVKILCLTPKLCLNDWPSTSRYAGLQRKSESEISEKGKKNFQLTTDLPAGTALTDSFLKRKIEPFDRGDWNSVQSGGSAAKFLHGANDGVVEQPIAGFQNERFDNAPF